VNNQISEQDSRKQDLIDKIQKEKQRFEYRDVLPKFNSALLQCLPNTENTPSEASLYEAFAAGNAEAVRAIPRSQRKQLFITTIAVNYADDVSKADFPSRDRQSSSRRRRDMMRGGGARGQQQPFFPGRGAVPGARPGASIPGSRPIPPQQTIPSTPEEAEAAQPVAGFTVLIEGYSPYQRISELLDPPMVGDNRNRWGMVTRFENMNEIFEDMPFELYNKSELSHFSVDTGLVDLDDPEMPAGIGTAKVIERVARPTTGDRDTALEMGGRGRNYGGTVRQDYMYEEDVLVDPMTGEEISKTYDIVTQQDVDANPDWTERDLGKIKTDRFGDQQFIERDRWFRIEAKFVWKNAPADTETTAETNTPMVP